MKWLKEIVAGILLLSNISAWAAVDHDPKNAGGTLGRNMTGSAFEASFYNPALLGVDLPPTGGILLAPLTVAGAGYWSDKLALSPFNRYWSNSAKEFSSLTSKILIESFDLDGLSPQEVSERLTEKLEGGFSLYSGGRATLLSVAYKRFAFDITTHVDEEVHVPEGPLYALFSSDHGLLRGNELDFKSFRQDGLWTTDFTMSLGLPVQIPVLHDLFKLRFGAGGLGIKYILGHAMMQARASEGTVRYNAQNNQIAVDGNLTLQTAGSGLHGAFEFENPFQRGIPANGHGIGINIGGILYDERGTMSVNFENLGVIFWVKRTKEVTYRLDKDDLDLYGIMKGVDASHGDGDSAMLTIFNRDENEYGSDSRDTLANANGFVTLLPMTMNIGYSYKFDFSKIPDRRGIVFLSNYALVAANYQQQLVKGPGTSYIPRLSLGSEFGVLNGYMPVRLGLVFGGAEKLGSALGLGFNFKYFSLQGSYKAVGTPWLYPKRGFELAGGVNVNWGMKAFPHIDTVVPPPPVHDTIVIHDTTITTVTVHDTVMIHDTVTVIKLQPTEQETKAVNKKLRAINFVTASAALTEDSYVHLNYIVDFLKKYSYLRYEIQGHTDSRGGDDYNLLLSAARAGSVRYYLLSQGVADSCLIGIGYGETRPIANNGTASGRALNRRVEFKVIDSDDEYFRLKMQEADFMERVRQAQIQGAQY